MGVNARQVRGFVSTMDIHYHLVGRLATPHAEFTSLRMIEVTVSIRGQRNVGRRRLSMTARLPTGSSL